MACDHESSESKPGLPSWPGPRGHDGTGPAVDASFLQAVIDAMYQAFNEGMREIATKDIQHAVRRQVPLSISQRETVGALRNWLKEGRAQSASFAEAGEAEEKFAGIPLELPDEG